MESLEDRQLLSALGSPDGPVLADVGVQSIDPAAIHQATPTRIPHYVIKGGSVPLGSPGPTGYTPAQIRQAYGVDKIVLNGGTAGTGAGQTIAIVDAGNDPYIAHDLAAFDATLGLPRPPSLTVLNQSGGPLLPAPDPTGGWEGEECLDVEWAHAIAPGARIILIACDVDNYDVNQQTRDLIQGARTAAGLPGVSVVSMSFSSIDPITGQTSEFSGERAFDSAFTTPSGHQGVTFLASTGDHGSPGGYPAYSPNVVAVGGTTLTINGTAGNYSYGGETGWSKGGDWWDATLATGGGVSRYEPEPSYQQGFQNTGRRTIPDVSFDADPATGVTVYDSYNNGTSDPWETTGGTSLSAPCWAGLIAIANQGRVLLGGTTLNTASDPTQTLKALYRLPIGFHDITSGNNGGYNAGFGYDFVTGRGSPIADQVVRGLVLAQFHPVTFWVTNTNDGGPGSLRAAISDAQVYESFQGFDTTAPNVIAFHIGSGKQTIALKSSLGRLPDAIVVDGTTQPGYAGKPLIELDGAGAGPYADGLDLVYHDTVRGLVINRFNRSGIGMNEGAEYDVVEGCYIGTDVTGTEALGNGEGVTLVSPGLNVHSANNRIGGPKAAQRNVISGNLSADIDVGPGSNDNWVEGNFIGTDLTGTKAIPEGENAIGVLLSGSFNQIGAGAPNVISGNYDGVVVAGTSNLMDGNFIGTDLTGTKGLGNSDGILIQASGNTVEFNVISANALGVMIRARSGGLGPTGNVVLGNEIGVDRTGTHPLGNGLDGVRIFGASNNLITGNIISSNAGNGVEINGNASPATLNRVDGNWIGTDKTGTLKLGNGHDGVLLWADSTAPANSYGNQIGGSSLWLDPVSGGGSVPAGLGNTIAFNGSDGVADLGTRMFGNPIRGNSIYANSGLGIDLQYPPSWTPTLRLASYGNGTSTQVFGSLSTGLSYTFLTLDFYASDPTVPLGNAQGRRYLSTFVVTTDAYGYAQFAATLPATARGEVITATATDYWGTTSPFSVGVRVS
jgi:hypothetical protein